MRSQSVVLLSFAAGIGCGVTDHVIGSVRGDRASAGSSGAESASAGAAGDATMSDGGSGAVDIGGAGPSNGGALDCAPSVDGAGCAPLGCGDGVEGSTESCDDGNKVDGDGCSAICTWEPPRGTLTAPPYGSAVAISGDTIVTGPFVFRRQGLVWTLEAKLAPSAPGGGHDPFDDPSNSTFANAVAISGDTIAIGTQNDSESAESAGAVHVFQRAGSSWVWQQKLLPTFPDGTHDGVLAEHFGWQLAFSEGTLAVGAQGDDDQGTSSGSVYVFRRDGSRFVPEAKLVATLPSGAADGADYFHFGTSVSLFGDTLVVGSTGSIHGYITNAAAYVFERSGSLWSPRAKLLPALPDGTPDITRESLFGAAVAVANGTIVVGDPGSFVNAGCAYVFEQDEAGWSVKAKLSASVPLGAGAVAAFGGATAIASTGDLILIGSPSDSHPVGYTNGSGHVFKRGGGGWQYDSALLAAIPADPLKISNGSLGSYVAVSGTELLLGSESASYLFKPKNSVWDTRLVIQIISQ